MLATNLIGQKVMFSHSFESVQRNGHTVSGVIRGVYLGDARVYELFGGETLETSSRVMVVIEYKGFNRGCFVELPLECCKIKDD